MVVFHCVTSDARLGYGAVWNFFYTLHMKNVILHCVLSDACLG
jgi:hypothetical protein